MNCIHENMNNFQYVIEKLNEFATERGYNITYTRRQRIYSKIGATESSNKVCEIFIRKIPEDVYEFEIIPVFERCGEINQFRIIIDFYNGTHYGYGFLSYTTFEATERAVKTLNNFPIRCDKYISVYKVIDNRRLFVGGICRKKSENDVKTALADHVVGIEKIIMYRSHEDEQKNRGYVFVDFQNPNLAEVARKKLSKTQLWGKDIIVDWADPIPEADPEVMRNVNKLYIRNLSTDLTIDQLNFELRRHINPNYVIKTYKNYNYAFVHFIDRNGAEESLELLQGVTIDGEPIEVTWARPPYYNKYCRRNYPPQDLCMCLPPITENDAHMPISENVCDSPHGPLSYSSIGISNSPNYSNEQSPVGSQNYPGDLSFSSDYSPLLPLNNDYNTLDFTGGNDNFTPMSYTSIPQQYGTNPNNVPLYFGNGQLFF